VQALSEHWSDDVYQHTLATARAHLDHDNATIRKAAGLKLYDQLLDW
jgi:hypothetical protein